VRSWSEPPVPAGVKIDTRSIERGQHEPPQPLIVREVDCFEPGSTVDHVFGITRSRREVERLGDLPVLERHEVTRALVQQPPERPIARRQGSSDDYERRPERECLI
jgi:hypothetical protein